MDLPLDPMHPEDSGQRPGPVQTSSRISFFKLLRMNILLLIGAGLFLLAILLAFSEHGWISKAKITEGEVIEIIRVRGSKGSSYKPRVRFMGSDGQPHEFVRSYSSNPPGFKTGEKVTVAYDAQSWEGRILTFGQRFGFAWVLGCVGMALALLSIGFAIGGQFVPRIYLR